MPCLTAAAYPPNSCPSVTGTASIRCVRPLLTTSANSAALASSTSARWARPRISTPSVLAAAMCTADGNTSLDDWDALTWSLGCTGRPSLRVASVAMTSLAFMFVDVPEPVWNTSSGKCSKWPPSPISPTAISPAASWIAAAISASMTPSSALTAAAADLIRASAMITSRGILLAGYGVDPGPLGLRAPQGVAGNMDLAHRVVLDPEPVVRRR